MSWKPKELSWSCGSYCCRRERRARGCARRGHVTTTEQRTKPTQRQRMRTRPLEDRNDYLCREQALDEFVWNRLPSTSIRRNPLEWRCRVFTKRLLHTASPPYFFTRNLFIRYKTYTIPLFYLLAVQLHFTLYDIYTPVVTGHHS